MFCEYVGVDLSDETVIKVEHLHNFFFVSYRRLCYMG